jgi:glycosyltransferase involved in cell wall biosynthesis
LKPLLVNTYDCLGGAARAANRLFSGLRKIGVDASLFVQEKSSMHPNIITPPRSRYGGLWGRLRTLADLQPLYSLYPERVEAPFSVHWLPGRYSSHINKLEPDLVNLHWISAGFLSVGSLKKIKSPMAWTLHDMWPFTGGCHYSQGCQKYIHNCEKCHLLKSKRIRDLSSYTFEKKKKNWQDLNFTIITPSKWLGDMAGASTLFDHRKIEVIPNGLDSHSFRPVVQKTARELLGLPKDKQLILFGCVNALNDPRKGVGYLQKALNFFKDHSLAKDTELVTFGTSIHQKDVNFNFKTYPLGYLNDDLSLALAYSAADIYISPALEENLANTILESMACGTPCLAFNIGGMGEMIEHLNSGYLAEPFEEEDLAKGVVQLLSNRKQLEKMGHRSREIIKEKFTFEIQARAYQSLYSKIIEGK